ncbi:hypothetical protein [Gottschalkia acidurici]|nr:hypothetical protein [Gottschalkia acidurici]
MELEIVNIYILLSLLLGYAIGRRIGVKQGIEEGLALAPLKFKKICLI